MTSLSHHLLHKVFFASLQEVTRFLDLLFVQEHQRPKSQVKLCRVLEQAAADPVILQINPSHTGVLPHPHTPCSITGINTTENRYQVTGINPFISGHVGNDTELKISQAL